MEELAILKIIVEKPSITQKELAEIIGKSERTIKAKTIELREKGLIERVNGKCNGYWKIISNLQ